MCGPPRRLSRKTGIPVVKEASNPSSLGRSGSSKEVAHAAPPHIGRRVGETPEAKKERKQAVKEAKVREWIESTQRFSYVHCVHAWVWQCLTLCSSEYGKANSPCVAVCGPIVVNRGSLCTRRMYACL